LAAQLEPTPKITPLDASHIPTVLEIERRAYPFPWSERIFQDCLKAGYSGWLLCDADGAIAGYALLSVAVDEAHVLNLCIDPRAQRRGLGRQLLRHLIRIARAANATRLLLEVRRSNRAALRLYESIGFERLGIRKAYYPAGKEREDALVLGLELV
jgi:ribosomal-protein-alanine N-acetyltransferase